MLVLMVGLPGTGKSTLCHALAECCKGVVLSKDSIRAALFEPGRVRYSSEQDDLVQEIMMMTAAWMLREDPALKIFFDGRTFSRNYQLAAAIAAAEKMETPWKIIECVCKPATARARLERDLVQGTHPAKNRDLALYDRLYAEFEPITLPKLVIDTDHPLSQCVLQAMYAL